MVISNSLGWYSGHVVFSDWKGIRCDFATNKYVANYYGNNSEFLGAHCYCTLFIVSGSVVTLNIKNICLLHDF